MAKKKSSGEKVNVKDDPGLMEFLKTQEKLTRDYEGKTRGKRRLNSCEYTLVRGPNQELLLVSAKKVIEIPKNDKDNQFLDDVNQLVRDYFAKYIPNLKTGPGVHVGTAEIFPK
jgi:hypothetical protein